MDVHRYDFIRIKNKKTESDIQRVVMIGDIEGISDFRIQEIADGINNGIAGYTSRYFLTEQSKIGIFDNRII